MSTAPVARLVEPGQGKTIMLFAVRFDYKVTSADSGGALSALEVTIPPKTLVKPHVKTLVKRPVKTLVKTQNQVLPVGLPVLPCLASSQAPIP